MIDQPRQQHFRVAKRASRHPGGQLAKIVDLAIIGQQMALQGEGLVRTRVRINDGEPRMAQSRACQKLALWPSDAGGYDMLRIRSTMSKEHQRGAEPHLIHHTITPKAGYNSAHLDQPTSIVDAQEKTKPRRAQPCSHIGNGKGIVTSEQRLLARRALPQAVTYPPWHRQPAPDRPDQRKLQP